MAESPAPPAAEPAPATPDRPQGTWLGAALIAALLELALAGWAWVAAAQGSCPEVPGLSCAALLRPRIGDLGLLHLSDLALCGAALSALACAGLWRLPAGPLRALAVAVPGLGAGLALAAQALALSASGSLCPLCLLVALCALASAALLARSLSAPERRRLVWVAALTCCLAIPSALARGAYLRADDAQRRAALASSPVSVGAPRLILVSRPGCAFCEALELDLLGDPSSAPLLARSAGLQKVSEGHELARLHAGGPGAPVLLVLGPQGELLGRLRGLRALSEVQEFLAARLQPR